MPSEQFYNFLRKNYGKKGISEQLKREELLLSHPHAYELLIIQSKDESLKQVKC